MGTLSNPAKVEVVAKTLDLIDREIKQSQERLLKKIAFYLADMYSGKPLSDADADSL